MTTLGKGTFAVIKGGLFAKTRIAHAEAWSRYSEIENELDIALLREKHALRRKTLLETLRDDIVLLNEKELQALEGGLSNQRLKDRYNSEIDKAKESATEAGKMHRELRNEVVKLEKKIHYEKGVFSGKMLQLAKVPVKWRTDALVTITDKHGTARIAYGNFKGDHHYPEESDYDGLIIISHAGIIKRERIPADA